MGTLEGKIAIITGANGGIGQAAAIELAKEGATLAVTDLKAEQGAETMAEVKKYAPNSIFIEMDVTDEDSVSKAIAEAVAKFGRIDIAVNNAGVDHPPTPVHELDAKTWKKVLSVNLDGQFLCAKHEIQQFLKQGGGTIVSVASMAGFLAIEGVSGYVASKHGTLGLIKTIAAEYGGQNIRANAVCPYYVKTKMTARADEALLETWRKGTPAGRLANLDELARAVVFFASDASSYCNGSALEIDGGMHVL